jgi:hypothetical protein
VADPLYRVELAASFLERLESIEAFLVEADAGFAFDDLLAEIRATVNCAKTLTPSWLRLKELKCDRGATSIAPGLR